MKWFLTNLFKKFLPKEVPKPLGRWKIEYCNTQLNQKVDLSNEDHCGPCGQYGIDKSVKIKSVKDKSEKEESVKDKSVKDKR